MIQYCKRCLYNTKHPLYLVIDDEGICSGCKVHEEKDIIDWKDKASELGKLLKSYKNTNGSNYDCIIPVSGGRDSYFIVHTIKNVFGMNPLLVTYNKHYNTAVGIRNIANLRIKFDCDLMTLTVDPNKVKKITRSTLRRFGSIYWHCIAGQTVFPVQIAVKFKIPLIIWGAHQGLDQVGMFSHNDQVEMSRKYRKEHDLMGFEAEDLIEDEFDFINESDIFQYRYPDDKEIEYVGVRGIYLNNFIRWDSRTQHEEMISKYEYETAQQNRTFDNYNDIDCWNYNDLHDYIKLIKHGYGKVLDQACREIRLGHMNKEKALDLVKNFMFKKPEYIELFLNWIGMTENGFNYVIDQHRNPLFWQRNENWEWEYSFDGFTNNKIDNLNQTREYQDFYLTKKGESSDSENKYILIGKGK